MEAAVFDPDTGEVIECDRCAEYLERISLLEADIENLERALRTERRKVNELRKELNDEREDDPRIEEARKLFDLWVQLTGRSQKRTKLDEDRKAKLLARLKDYDYDQVQAAIEGAADDPFKRGEKRYDDIKTVCKNAQVFEEMRDRGYKARERKRQAAQAQRKVPALDRLLTLLRQEGTEWWQPEPGVYVVPCPKCTVPAKARDDDGWLAVACPAGCDPYDAVQAFEWEWAEVMG